MALEGLQVDRIFVAHVARAAAVGRRDHDGFLVDDETNELILLVVPVSGLSCWLHGSSVRRRPPVRSAFNTRAPFFFPRPPSSAAKMSHLSPGSMKLAGLILVLFFGAVGFAAEPSENADHRDMEKTMAGITAGFSSGDLDAIASYHHPDVEKALSFTKCLKGREAVISDLRGTLQAYSLQFTEHEVESLEFFGDTCVEVTRFAVRGEPKGDAPAFTFRGRAMVVYVRYAGSPSGWASIREVIQPATD